MAHLNELCPTNCVFNADDPVEKKNACDYCWISEVIIIPAIKAIDVWGKEGEIIAEYKDRYFFRTKMSNGKYSTVTINKSRIKRK